MVFAALRQAAAVAGAENKSRIRDLHTIQKGDPSGLLAPFDDGG